MTLTDIERVVELEQINLNTTLGSNYFKQTINDSHSFFLVAKENNDIIGYISSTIDEYSEILNFFVVDKYRRKGIGEKLLTKVIDEAIRNNSKSIYLEVNEINQNAISLYLKKGFKKDHIRKNYYNDHDAFVLIKEL